VALTLVMALVDASAGPSLILVDLMSVGPCLAAASGTPRQVLGVGGLVVGLNLLVSVPDEIWGEAEQAYGLVATVAVTAISIMVAQRRRQLETRAARLAAIVDSSDDAIVARDLDGRIVSWNRTAEAMFGDLSTLDETGTERTGRVVLPVDAFSDLPDRILRGERVEGVDTTRTDVDGVSHPVRVTAGPIRGDRHREPIGYYTVTRDLTEQRAVEKQRDSLAGRLQQTDRLDSLGQLAGGVAHDFNNLLSVILNYAELASDDPAHAKADLEAIQDAATRGAALTRQLLTFSRAEQHHAEVVDVGELALSVAELLSRTLPATIDLTVDVADGSLRVLADPTQIEQLVMNLTVNARDAMPAGGQLSIEVGRRGLDDFAAANYPALGPGSWLVVTVTDTGEGMSKEVVEHAFEPFFTTKPRGSGTGLGLATVYGIVRQLGGDASIYSEEGHGTTVRLYLPPTDAPVETAAVDASRTSGAVPTVTRTGRVLVVEDQSMLRDAVRRMLDTAGFAVTDVETAEDALAAARADWPDLLVTDVMLPGRSGIELAADLQAERPLAVILMSGYTAPVLGDGLGDHVVLQKPFTLAAFLAAVDEALAAPPR
jgi:PAS domain S-box-containing protein